MSACLSLLAPIDQQGWKDEIVYQIFPRSYFDSNGDHIGDLTGIALKLPTIKQMGFTSILVNPIFKSRVYHNYFADDFFQVDPALGTNESFYRLVRKAHALGMKVILDMETQYVADQHPWFAEPQFQNYVWKKGSAFYDLKINWWGGSKAKIAAINPDLPEVIEAGKNIFRFWTCPNGSLDSGVDGFRIDHMMDDLDNQHVKKNVLSNYWKPIIEATKQVRPDAIFLAEQSD